MTPSASNPYPEDALVERPALGLLDELAWTVASAWSEMFGPAGTLGRDSMREVAWPRRGSEALPHSRGRDTVEPILPAFRGASVLRNGGASRCRARA